MHAWESAGESVEVDYAGYKVVWIVFDGALQVSGDHGGSDYRVAGRRSPGQGHYGGVSDY